MLSANVTKENLMVQTDKEGHRQIMLDDIIDSRWEPNTAISIPNVYINTKNSTVVKRSITRG